MIAFSVACVCGTSLVALRWVLAHREKKFEHAPIAALEAKLAELENRLLSNTFRR